MAPKVYLAVDIGAGSGRVIAGRYDGRRLTTEGVHRFANRGVHLPTGWHWNLPQLFAEIVAGIGQARERYGDALVSIAVDTWAVDYGLLDRSGRLLGLPWMYRDSRHDGGMEAAARRVPIERIYERTGIQPLPFNTVFQLMAEGSASPDALRQADKLLFIPDLLTFWLSGEAVTERTNASTSMLLRAGRAEWDLSLAEELGLPTRMLMPITEPGRPAGRLRDPLAKETGARGLRVVTCASHDTASAVVGVPAGEEQPLFLSSGTWSLIGRELPEPVVTAESFRAGFSNEHGLGGTTRFLKNVTGMWLLQECQRNWRAAGMTIDDGELAGRAGECRIDAWIDPDHPDFQRPCDMPKVINDHLRSTGQPAAESPAELARVILQSLARRYGELAAPLAEMGPHRPSRLHVVGGGSQNELLNQLTADATGLPVEAGPSEATAIGNVVAQMMADNEIGSLAEGRRLIRDSVTSRVFEPAAVAGDYAGKP